MPEDASIPITVRIPRRAIICIVAKPVPHATSSMSSYG
jgi:hypothetical protein